MIIRPLIALLFSYIAGLILGSYVDFPVRLTLIILSLLIIAYLISIIRHGKLGSYLPFLLFLILGVLFIGRYLHFQPPPGHIASYAGGKRINIEGTLYRSPEVFQDKTRLYLEVERIYTDREVIPTCGKIMISGKQWEGGLSYGDRVRTAVRLRRPRNFYNPGGFNYERYLASRRIHATGYLRSSREIVRVGEGEYSAFLKLIETLRARIRGVIENNSDYPESGILKALILGERGEIPDEVRESFIIAGVAHILAISGLHVGILALVIFWLFRSILRVSERIILKINIFKVASVLTIFPLVIYTLIAGARVSTIRALIMVVTYLAAIIIDREEEIFNTLALAAFIILVVFPSSVFDISFQLSFISVWAIIYIVPRALEFFKQEDILLASKPASPLRRFKGRVGVFILVSLSAIIGTTPLVAHYFNRLSIWGIFANVVIVPLIGFLSVPLCLLAGLFVFIQQSVAGFLFYLASFPVDLAIRLVEQISSFPFASLRVTTPRLGEISLWYFLIVSLINIKGLRWTRYVSCLLLLAVVGNCGYWYWVNNYNSKLKVSFLSVGQGDSALVEFPRGVKMLIDGGGFYDESFDTGELIVAPFLWWKKIKRIDYLVMSHPQIDHFGGLKFIAQNFPVKELWMNGDEGECPTYWDFLQIIDEKGIKKRLLSAKSPDQAINGVKVEFLGPTRDRASTRLKSKKKGSAELNNNSLVLRLTFGDLSLLFTGDILDQGESELGRSGRDPVSTVIKVPHHGSISSSSYVFLKKVRPEVAVISAGYENVFGFPHEKVLKRYEELGIRVYRTDQDGAIEMKADGEELKIKTYLRNK